MKYPFLTLKNEPVESVHVHISEMKPRENSTRKRCYSSIAAFLIALCMLTGCGRTNTAGTDSPASGSPGQASEFDLSALKTVGDAFAYDSNPAYSLTEEYYVYSFEVDGTVYRVIADLPSDVSDKVWKLDSLDDNYENDLKALLSPLEIRKAENLTELIPPQEEAEKLVGKTGQELLDDGWTFSGWNLDNMEFWMNHEIFAYTVIFDGKADDKEDFNEEDIAPFTVKSITIDGIGDSTYME